MNFFFQTNQKSRIEIKKSQTCKEGGAHFRMSVWHLLMNLKNNNLLKELLSGPIKNVRLLIFTMLHQNFEKIKKITGDIIILQKCSKNNNHKSSWDTEWNRQKFLYPSKNLKNQNLENINLELSSLYTCALKIMNIWCMLPIMECNWHNFLSFWSIFCHFSPLLTLKIHIVKKKIVKKKKKYWRYYPFHMCTINEDHMMYGSWDMEHNRQFFVILPPNNQKIKILKK